ncbi:Oidioi.mRNA.OKI2018_I69.XSR.g14548.t1.cds [Oikopleura dioica]|uniref:Oidioi.mRNA.OKI2018_I69.XSR.g14548.t1.cds n=1 Tax=Oikopleura dioica TaxID=34765 RepID=A0ABN7SBX3_OIKDI|nr:Oidioi.mRNA.OKI2018_I69.XSR.g14548.t1.cds [Oikopleura dioica]
MKKFDDSLDAVCSKFSTCAWTEAIIERLNRHPIWRTQKFYSPNKFVCGVCMRVSNCNTMVDVQGHSYDPSNFAIMRESGNIPGSLFVASEYCLQRGARYHQAKHFKYYMAINLKGSSD